MDSLGAGEHLLCSLRCAMRRATMSFVCVGVRADSGTRSCSFLNSAACGVRCGERPCVPVCVRTQVHRRIPEGVCLQYVCVCVRRACRVSNANLPHTFSRA